MNFGNFFVVLGLKREGKNDYWMGVKYPCMGRKKCDSQNIFCALQNLKCALHFLFCKAHFFYECMYFSDSVFGPMVRFDNGFA